MDEGEDEQDANGDDKVAEDSQMDEGEDEQDDTAMEVDEEAEESQTGDSASGIHQDDMSIDDRYPAVMPRPLSTALLMVTTRTAPVSAIHSHPSAPVHARTSPRIDPRLYLPKTAPKPPPTRV
ncbi:uncharacterized protein C8R40DRAFT_1101243 [Lentinula edodes]|uniref:uncharacterized protein n=1 Tax=Lentinula edodes TaxID=5353 RepID=UPI001E8E7AC4|nr:uncharacterized protein C8R40DRAFT_1101243 [Lentinula edodes]KAH7875785.1 hypothetical protein C8R40DRAFT_1101243 [Lentinula edodes]